jgi:hypothetical protein
MQKKHSIKYTKKKRLSKVNRLYRSKHKYFINKCIYDDITSFDYSILENYLKKLGCVPDKIMNQFASMYLKQAKQNRITFKDFCDFKYQIKPKIDNKTIKQITADIMFYDNVRPYLNINLYNVISLLINVLNIDFYKITNKNVIYNNISQIDHELSEKYLIKTFHINRLREYHFPSWYILRPIDSFGGADIKYINNQTDLNNAITYYKTTKNYRGILYGNNVIASPYITNLLLFHGRKFHLRMYYIVSCINRNISSFLLDDGKIVTAAEPFDMNEPFTKEKHDTHHKSTNADYFISKDFTTENIGIEINETIIKQIFTKCKTICAAITKVIINKTNGNLLFENQKNGFNLFGLDIFITKDLQPILIECNEKPGIGTFIKNNNIIISKILLGWINSIILEPLLKYNDPTIAHKHKTYIRLS